MNTLTGTRALLRLNLRRDRVLLPIWILISAGVVASTAASFKQIITDVSGLIAANNGNPAFLALYGPVYDDSLGALTVWRIGGSAGLLLGFMSVFLIVRHTRADEEAGRTELVGSTVVGRHAPATAALLTVVLAQAAIGVLVALGLVANDVPARGSALFGASIALCGWAFAGIAAVAAQLSENARTTNGIGVLAVVVAFLVRAVGDANATVDEEPTLSWLSPIGWIQRARPYTGDRWWVLALPAVLTVLATLLAFALAARRDVGAGLVPPRPGPATASRALGSPLGLAWRLQRSVLASWTVGLAALGVLFAALSGGIETLLRDNPQMAEAFQRMGGTQRLTDAFFAAIFGFVGLATAGYATQAVLRLRSEESGQRAEAVLATSVGRSQWAGSHVLIAALGTVTLLAVNGLATGVTQWARTGEVDWVPRLLGAALVQAPAAWLVAAIGVALFGLLPRLVVVTWGALVAFLLLAQLGAVLRFPQWVMDVSPFTHTPPLPAVQITWTPVLVLLAVGVALVGFGMAAFQRRDVAS